MNIDRIKALREDNDLSQAKLAEHLGISQKTYSKYETGIRSFPISVLIDLAIYYDVSLDYLLCLSKNKQHHRGDIS